MSAHVTVAAVAVGSACHVQTLCQGYRRSRPWGSDSRQRWYKHYVRRELMHGSEGAHVPVCFADLPSTSFTFGSRAWLCSWTLAAAPISALSLLCSCCLRRPKDRAVADPATKPYNSCWCALCMVSRSHDRCRRIFCNSKVFAVSRGV